MLKIKIDSKRQIKPVRRTWIRACEALLWHSADPPPDFIRLHQFQLARLPVHEAIRYGADRTMLIIMTIR